MNIDFTLDKYHKLCKSISNSSYQTITMNEFFSSKQKPQKYILIRHDVDSEPNYALKMATIEAEMGISSTYYFRYGEGLFLPKLMKNIENMGHEIGYHYEVLNKSEGDFAQAIVIFANELNEFRQVCDVKTIAQHGSPLIGNLRAISISGIYDIVKMMFFGENVFTHWESRDLWTEYNFMDFGILGEAYLSLDFSKLLYISDTGRSWDSTKYKIKDLVEVSNGLHNQIKVKHTDDIIKIINDGNINMCILVHSNQWKENFREWLKWLMFQQVRNVGKLGLKTYWKITNK